MRNLPGPGNTPENCTAVTQQPGTLGKVGLRNTEGSSHRKPSGALSFEHFCTFIQL